MEKLKPKLFSVMKTYTKQQFVKDVIAGIIVAIIALPLSIALALASGVGPEQGIYTAIIAGFLISFLGGSRVQIAGPTAAFATIVAGIVAQKGKFSSPKTTLVLTFPYRSPHFHSTSKNNRCNLYVILLPFLSKYRKLQKSLRSYIKSTKLTIYLFMPYFKKDFHLSADQCNKIRAIPQV